MVCADNTAAIHNITEGNSRNFEFTQQAVRLMDDFWFWGVEVILVHPKAYKRIIDNKAADAVTKKQTG